MLGYLCHNWYYLSHPAFLDGSHFSYLLMKRTTYISKGEKLWPYIIKSWKSFLKITFEIVLAYYITISQINDRIIGCLVLQPVTSKQLKLSNLLFDLPTHSRNAGFLSPHPVNENYNHFWCIALPMHHRYGSFAHRKLMQRHFLQWLLPHKLTTSEYDSLSFWRPFTPTDNTPDEAGDS